MAVASDPEAGTKSQKRGLREKHRLCMCQSSLFCPKMMIYLSEKSSNNKTLDKLAGSSGGVIIEAVGGCWLVFPH